MSSVVNINMLHQPAFRNIRIRTLIQPVIDIRNALHTLLHRPDVMAYQNNGMLPVDFLQQRIQTSLETLVDIRIRLVQDDHLRICN